MERIFTRHGGTVLTALIIAAVSVATSALVSWRISRGGADYTGAQEWYD